MGKLEPKIISGNVAIDARGKVAFVNDFNFTGVKRFYQLEPSSSQPIRAFHGHMNEAKYVYVATGSILLVLARLDNPQSPSKKTKLCRCVLSDAKPAIVYIPPGYANGFKALTRKTKIVVFSTSSLHESEKDDYRFPYDYWGTAVWKVTK